MLSLVAMYKNVWDLVKAWQASVVLSLVGSLVGSRFSVVSLNLFQLALLKFHRGMGRDSQH